MTMFRTRRLFGRETREVLCVVLIVTITFVQVGGFPAPSAQAQDKTASAATQGSWGMTTVDDKPFVLNELIDGLSQDERIQLAISLQLLPKIKTEDFGQYGLRADDQYADSNEDVTKDKPLRPETFNQVPANVIKAAIKAERFSEEDYLSPVRIKNGLLWVANSKLWYPTSSSENIDYHKIVRWVAGKKGIDSEQVDALPTFELERKIVEKYFADIWDKLTPKQREELLKKIEEETHSKIGNKGAIALMGGGAAVAALGVTVAFTGFAFYTTMSVVMCTVAGWFGITLPFAAYMGASGTVALLSGPIGWGIAVVAVTGGAIWGAWPSADKTAVFIMQLHFIKAQQLKQKGILK
jgi:uncharacterized protein YaaW (UPF0174 family)